MTPRAFFLIVALAAPAAAQLPSASEIPSVQRPLPANSKRIFTTIRIPVRPAPVPMVIYVSPHGSDNGDGSAQHPLQSLARAKIAVRSLNRNHDVTVRL